LSGRRTAVVILEREEETEAILETPEIIEIQEILGTPETLETLEGTDQTETVVTSVTKEDIGPEIVERREEAEVDLVPEIDLVVAEADPALETDLLEDLTVAALATEEDPAPHQETSVAVLDQPKRHHQLREERMEALVQREADLDLMKDNVKEARVQSRRKVLNLLRMETNQITKTIKHCLFVSQK